MKKLALFLLSFSIALTALAQPRQIKGNVTDENRVFGNRWNPLIN